jgi:DNA-binding response OmpR family regulator
MFKGKKILVAEDDRDVVEMYRDYFKINKITREGEFTYTYDEATTREALERGEFDVLLLDLGLKDVIPPPGLKIIKDYAGKVPTRIVVLSGYPEYEEESRMLGANEFFRKPTAMPYIVEALKRCLWEDKGNEPSG